MIMLIHSYKTPEIKSKFAFKSEKLEEKVVKLESEQNFLTQYSKRNNIMISGMTPLMIVI